ncbi:unnamed protein product [Rangifer tarandus platyrhynchus]|uniref:Uncharacterized protein n=2 Tax=Rangifer tarandus platyrhynchus TaxID=3082113 RepID=A0ABN8YYS5_RANTA|nr:unnamed protein product [Rangifer tarandus platyrhynchus]
MCPTEVPTPLPARSPEPWVSHVATPDEFELVALGSHLPGCGMALRRDHLEQGRTQEPPEHGGRCTRLRRARCPPPPQPRRAALASFSQVGRSSVPPLLFSAGLRVLTHPRLRRRDGVFQDVTFPPAGFPAL